MNSIVIDEATINDLDDILLLENQLDHERYSGDMIKSSLEGDSYYNLVAKQAGSVIGYISCTIVCDECSLLKIVTHKDCRRRGIAQKLIDSLFQYCKSIHIKTVFLEVRNDNISAIALYKKNGFAIQGIRKKYYGDADAVLYYKEFDA